MKFIFFIGVLFINFFSFAQAGTEEQVTSAESFSKKELNQEKKYLDFKKSFIESLAQKATENYDKALELLNACEDIYPDNVPMLFEKAKNYYKLKQYVEAHYYCDKALEIEPDNFWIKSLSRDVYEREFQYEKAILIQEELFKEKKSEAQNLLKLYYRNKDLEKGKALLQTIDQQGIYTLGLSFYNKYFYQKEIVATNQSVSKINDKNIKDLQRDFSINKDFKILRQLLIKFKEQQKYQELLAESETGLTLFPAQAEVYLYKGIALNALKHHKEAALVLEEGLDFVFDKPMISKEFYLSLIQAYKALNNTVKVNHYQEMVQKL
jgi:tetratricopeptide (TPR) repeat protein